MVKLTKIATEGSTFVVPLEFKDEDGQPVTPATDVNWRLLDKDGSEISSGSVTASSSSVDIVLKGDDLTLTGTGNIRILTLVIETTYDSSRGAGLPLVEMVTFSCNNVIDR